MHSLHIKLLLGADETHETLETLGTMIGNIEKDQYKESVRASKRRLYCLSRECGDDGSLLCSQYFPASSEESA